MADPIDPPQPGPPPIGPGAPPPPGTGEPQPAEDEEARSIPAHLMAEDIFWIYQEPA